MSVDPRRLIDPRAGAPDDLRALLRSADMDGPSIAQLRRLTARLEPQLSTTPAAPTQVGTVAVGKAFAVVAVIAIVVGVIGFVVGRESTLPVAPNAVVSIPDARAPVIDAGAIAIAVDAAPIIDPTPTTRPPSPSRTSRRPAHGSSTSTPPPSRPASVQPASNEPAPVEDELAVLGRAQRALVAGDAATALELAERHARTFPAAMMIEEREAIAIEALARLGRAEAAASRFATFRDAHPRSSYRHRLERLLSVKSL